ncbi:hypothetical protein V8F06_001172 [Rhypophila decipiens]
MTRPIVYGAALAVLIAATIMTITSVATTEWVTYSSVSSQPGLTNNSQIHDKIGLYKRCTTVDGIKHCSTFPDERTCSTSGGESEYDRALCSTWKTAGFLEILAVMVELVTVVGFMLAIGGGKQKREKGWKLLCALMGAAGVLSFVGMSIVAILLDQDDMFNVPGYKLDRSWYLATVSSVMTVAMSFGLAVSAFMLAPEDGYEILRDSPGVRV